jgi:hypothetical protein
VDRVASAELEATAVAHRDAHLAVEHEGEVRARVGLTRGQYVSVGRQGYNAAAHAGLVYFADVTLQRRRPRGGRARNRHRLPSAAGEADYLVKRNAEHVKECDDGEEPGVGAPELDIPDAGDADAALARELVQRKAAAIA